MLYASKFTCFPYIKTSKDVGVALMVVAEADEELLSPTITKFPLLSVVREITPVLEGTVGCFGSLFDLVPRLRMSSVDVIGTSMPSNDKLNLLSSGFL